jgi:flagellar basal body-associated protein FliL
MADTENIEEIAEPPKKSNMLIIIIIVVVNIAILAVVLIVVLGGKSDGGDDAEKSQQSAKRDTRSKNIDGPIIELDGFVVNLSNSREYKYLKTEIAVQLFAETDAEFFEKQRPLVRNEVLMQLAGIEIEMLQTREGKEQLQKDLAKKINARLDMDRIAYVFFVEFVVQ